MKIGNFGEIPISIELQATPAVAHYDEVVTAHPATQFLDFEKNKVQELTLDQLSRTMRENRGDNNTPMHGIYHFALIQQLLDMCAQHGYDAEVYDLFATNNKDKQTPGVSLNDKLQDRYGVRAVEAHTLRRIYANIRIKNFDDGETTTNIALAYTQKGIQLGIGTNVCACHNQNLMGQGHFISDYTTQYRYAHGDFQKLTLPQMMACVGSWLTNLENIVVTERQTIEQMKRTVISGDDIFKIIGLLMATRVSADTTIKRIKYTGNVYPLNQTQLGKFVEGLLVKQKDEGRITAWSMYNCATDLYKPQTAETNLIMPQNLSFVDFMRGIKLI